MATINQALKALGAFSSRARKRELLEPFIIELALTRLERKLTLAEQKLVMRAVGDPARVNWPDWWVAV